MNILDTHVWIWLINNDTARLKSVWMPWIEGNDDLAVSAISCVEVAWLWRHGRLRFACPLSEWFDKALDEAGIKLVPITPATAGIAVQLPEHHRDPHDRLIIASAIEHKATLISADGRFGEYRELDGRLIS